MESVLAIIFSNSFTHYQAEQMKKDAVCVQFFLSKHTGETGEDYFNKIEQFHLHTTDHVSNVLFIL